MTIRINKEMRITSVDEDQNDYRFDDAMIVEKQNLRDKSHRKTKEEKSWEKNRSSWCLLPVLKTCRQNTSSLKNH